MSLADEVHIPTCTRALFHFHHGPIPQDSTGVRFKGSRNATLLLPSASLQLWASLYAFNSYLQLGAE